MQSVWKILAPVNLDEHTGPAVEHAIGVANETAAELVLLHVLDRRFYSEARKAGWPPQSMGTVDGFTNIQRVVSPGDPAATISRYADFINANMVLITSSSRCWTRLWKGSLRAEVLDSTHRPVLVTSRKHIHADHRFRCRKILCVLSLDGTDDPIIECATALAARTGAEIVILHVVPEASENLLSWGIAGSDRPLSRAVAIDRIRALADALPVSHTTAIMTGALHKNISVVAKQMTADVILVGRARPGVWAPGCPDLGAVLSYATCPVISVPVSDILTDAQPVRRYRQPSREKVLCDI
jgi:nucleotide-binding universal stress UspA family protein